MKQTLGIFALQQPELVPERRCDPRYSIDEDAILQIVGRGASVRARIVDLSQEGCRVRAREQIQVRARWPVEITFKVLGVDFRFSAVVEWADEPQNLLGLRFVNMIPRRMVELSGIICEMQVATERRARAVNEFARDRQAPESPRPELRMWVADQGVPDQKVDAHPVDSAPVPGHLSAPFKIPSNPIPAAPAQSQPSALPPASPAAPQPVQSGPAKSGPAEIDPAQAARGRDRRAQSRQEVDTSAVIFLVKIASTLRGRILDLSLGGCRIRTDERFPVGIYTRLETEFRLEGIPFRLGGVIQAIHDRNTVGIRFLDLSERKRQQVLDLMGEIQDLREAQLRVELADQSSGA